MGISYGRDILEGHGNFSIDADPFFGYAANWSVSGGVAAATSTGTSESITRASAVIVGKFYEVTFTISAITGTGIRAQIGGTGLGTIRNATGTYTEILKALGNAAVGVQCTANSTCTIDNWIIREVISYNKISVALSRGLRV